MERYIDFTDQIETYFSDVKRTLDAVDMEEVSKAMNALLSAYTRDMILSGSSAFTA